MPRMPSHSHPPAIFLMGPTASGKTALACTLADQFPVELVSVDSALVYRGMDIGTAKPSPGTLARYPHALVDIRDPAQPYSAADFAADALIVMKAISARGNIPLLVGGTGLYFRALHEGLSNLPEADPDVRARLATEAKEVGWAAMHRRLAGLDPIAGERIKPGDAQRIQRALEVIELTGRPLSEQSDRAHRPPPERTAAIHAIALWLAGPEARAGALRPRSPGRTHRRALRPDARRRLPRRSRQAPGAG